MGNSSNPSPVRNRIREHRQVRAGDLHPHPRNWRQHPDDQRDLLRALYTEVGFARSLLAYERDDGQLQLIDGHLRRELTPDALVTVEVLDVNEQEAAKLLLSLDPLAQLVVPDADTFAGLLTSVATENADLKAFWQGLSDHPAKLPEPEPTEVAALPQSFLILVGCPTAEVQEQLLARLLAEGYDCKPLTSPASCAGPRD